MLESPEARLPLSNDGGFKRVGIHRRYWGYARLAGSEFLRHGAMRLAASLAYYTIFSLVPLLMVVIAVAGLAFGTEAVSDELVDQLRRLIGVEGATTIQALIAGAAEPTRSKVATVVGVVALGVGATGVFVELQHSLNAIWDVRSRPGRGLLTFLRKRILSFGMVLGIGFLLLVSIVISSALAAFNRVLGGVVPGSDAVWMTFDFVLSYIIVTGLFSLIFKTLPEVRVQWRDVWVGALVSAGVFSLAKLVLSQYIGNGSFGSEFGAAGSMLVILLWVHTAAAVLFYGAEFTKVYATAQGRGVIPSKRAVLRATGDDTTAR